MGEWTEFFGILWHFFKDMIGSGWAGWLVLGVLIYLIYSIIKLPFSMVRDARERRATAKLRELLLKNMSPEAREKYLAEGEAKRQSEIREREKQQRQARQLMTALQEAQHDEYVGIDKNGFVHGPFRDAGTARQNAGEGGRVEWRKSF